MNIDIPVLNRDYLFQENTEKDKNKQFDKSIKENKEAAWAGIGTNEIDSKYQPSPIQEPNYEMKYASKDDYDYLKSYRLIWGYGIGISETEVIVSLNTGEHLAEGTEECNAYEQKHNKDNNYKRGFWVQLTGGNNKNPRRISSVELPENIISLKNLCTNLLLTDICVFEQLDISHIINTDNMFGNMTNSYIQFEKNYIFDFSSVKSAQYMFAGTDYSTNIPTLINITKDCNYSYFYANTKMTEIPSEICNVQGIGGEGMFYHTQFINQYTISNLTNMKLYSKMFYSLLNGIIGENNNFNECDNDVSSAFYNDTFIEIPIINYSNATIFTNLFNNIHGKQIYTFNIDFSSIVNIKDSSKIIYFTDNNYTFNIISPLCKYKGTCVFSISRCNINFINDVHYIDIWDFPNKCALNEDITNNALICGCDNLVTGTIYGCQIFSYKSLSSIFDNFLIDGSNVIIKTEEKPNNLELVDIIKNYKNDYGNYNLFPTLFTLGIYTNDDYNIDFTFAKYINVDDYYFVNSIFSLDLLYTYIKHSINSNNILNINKENKEFCIINQEYISPIDLNININNNSYIYIGNTFYDKIYNIAININSNDKTYNIININNVEENKEETIIKAISTHQVNYNFLVINAPTCKLLIDNYDYYIDRPVDYITYYTFNFENINTIELKNITFTPGIMIGSDRINVNIYAKYIYKLIHNLSNKVLNGRCINKLLTIHTNKIDNIESSAVSDNINFIPNTVVQPYDLFDNEINYINYPNMIHTNGNLQACCVYGLFTNIYLSDFLKRSFLIHTYETFNTYRDYLAYYFNIYTYKNYIEHIIKDNFATDNIIDIKNENFYYNKSFGFILTGDWTDYIINIRLFMDSYNNYNYFGGIESEYLKINHIGLYSAADLQYIESSDLIIDILDGISQNYFCNINIDDTNNINKLTINLLNSIGDGANGGIIINIPDILTELYINSYDGHIIYKNLDLSYCNALNQESINSICKAENFHRDTTITINTIPFQYITNEQKENLVNNNITLIEYIDK